MLKITIPYRTRLRLQRIGTVALLLIMVAILAWFCWVLWLERYVIYNDDGAVINFELSSERLSGVEAKPPVQDTQVGIYFNEGDNSIETQAEMVQMAGYYVTVDDLVNDFAGVREKLIALPTGTPVMIEMKSRYGVFYYPSQIPDVQFSESVDVNAMVDLIDELKMRGLYLIAKVPAFRDYLYGVSHITSGLPVKGGYLWMDDAGYYWLKPNDAGTMSFITSIILELKDLGFAEVALGDFKFPESDRIVYHGDPVGDIDAAAKTLVSSCSTTFFAVSFIAESPSFALPEGRTRMYLENVAAQNVGFTAAQVSITDPKIRLVFIATTNDTRYNEYSVLRQLSSAEELEQQNG